MGGRQLNIVYILLSFSAHQTQRSDKWANAVLCKCKYCYSMWKWVRQPDWQTTIFENKNCDFFFYFAQIVQINEGVEASTFDSSIIVVVAVVFCKKAKAICPEFI